jgi:hypothetical protein
MRKALFAIITLAIILASCANGTDAGDAPKDLSFAEAIAKLPSPASLGPLGLSTTGAAKAALAFDPAAEPVATSPVFVEAFANGGFESIAAVIFNELREKMLNLSDADLTGATIDLGPSAVTGKNFYSSFAKVEGIYRALATTTFSGVADPVSICLDLSQAGGLLVVDGYIRFVHPMIAPLHYAFRYDEGDGSFYLLLVPYAAGDSAYVPLTAKEIFLANIRDGSSARYAYVINKLSGLKVNYGYADAGGSCFVYTDGTTESSRLYHDSKGSVFFSSDGSNDEYRLSAMSSFPGNIFYDDARTSDKVFIDGGATETVISEGVLSKSYSNIKNEGDGLVSYYGSLTIPFISVAHGAPLPAGYGTPFVFKKSLLDEKSALDAKLSGLVYPLAMAQKTAYDDASLLAFIDKARAYSYPALP